MRLRKRLLTFAAAPVQEDPTPEFSINFVALLVAAIVRTALGAIWYSPVLFGHRWMTLVGCSESEMRARMPRALIIDLVANFVMAFVLVHAVHYASATSAAQGLAVGFFNWIGFVAVATLFSVIFEGRPLGLFAINNGFQLLSLLVMGAIVAVWR